VTMLQLALCAGVCAPARVIQLREVPRSSPQLRTDFGSGENNNRKLGNSDETNI
jgi:hypothetical protein